MIMKSRYLGDFLNVFSEVVKNNRCIGCGVCVGICPTKNLKIDFNDFGCYEIFDSKNCLEKCNLCLKICPFYKKDLDEDRLNLEIFKDLPNFIDEFGKFSKTYEFSKLDLQERLKSASGGAGSFLLNKFVELNLVDKIIAIKPNDDPKKLFKFAIFSNQKELEISKSSAYYPVSLDEISSYILQNDFRYAITALPCFAKALRNLQNTNYKAKKRIKFIIGLVCGQMKSKNFTEHLANLSFGKKVELKKVNFRKKQHGKLASNFAFEFTSFDDFISVDYLKFPVKFWTSRAFTPKACNNCLDTFAKCADCALMDAWLDDKIKDYSGHSLIISRNKTIDEILQNSQNEAFCKEFPQDLVLKSNIGAFNQKKEFFYENKNDFLTKKIVNLKKEIQNSSFTNKNFEEIFQKNIKKIKKLEKIRSKIASLKIYLKNPKKIVQKFKRIING